MTMDPAAFHAVYVDRRAIRDRVEHRSKLDISNHLLGSVELNGATDEHNDVQQNIRTLLRVFSSVSVCTSAQSCISILSSLGRDDPSPALVLIDIPLEPQPEEENSVHDGRHDSGIASGPADMLGLPLLKFISIEIDNMRMSASILPVAVLTNDSDGDVSDVGTEGPPGLWVDHNGEARELQCVDNGALDVLKSPFSNESAKALYMHCYRAQKYAIQPDKKSRICIQQPPSDNYSYLREKMVRELMTEICKPKMTNLLGSGQIRIPDSRATIIKQAIGQWEFCAHAFSDDELVYCAQLIFEHAFTMPEVSDYAISSDRLVGFLLACRGSYNELIPYHNFRHVVDVLQAVFYFLLQLGALPQHGQNAFSETTSNSLPSLAHTITRLDALTLLIVAVGHDVGHPGVNNAFLVNLKAPLAQVYNDRSVLESFHCATFSQVLMKHWPKTLEMRKMMIDMILATDMGLHFEYMGKLEKLRKKQEKYNGSDGWDKKLLAENRNLLCALLIKCADISNVARTHDVSAQWATILVDEFAMQARIEDALEVPTSLVAPPVTGSVEALAGSQVGFMDIFAIPLFGQLSTVLPEMKFSVRELTINRELWSIKKSAAQAKKAMNGAEFRSSNHWQSYDNTRLQSSVCSLSSERLHGIPRYSRHLPPVLGTALMDSNMPASDSSTVVSGGVRSAFSSPPPELSRSEVAVQRSHTGNGNTTAVTLVVTHPKQSAVSKNGVRHFTEKVPTYQHSTEHLRPTDSTSQVSSQDRPRSSPPDFGDCNETSCSSGCCGHTPPTAVVVNTPGTVERRSSRFFKKVKLWKTWRKEPSDG